MIERYSLNDGTLHATTVEDAPLLLCTNPTAQERDFLHRNFKVDAHMLDSALDPDEVSRIEFHDGQLFLIWKRPESYSGAAAMTFEVSSFGLMLSSEKLVVISAGNSLLSTEGTHRPLENPLDILIDLLFNSVHHYLGHLRVIKMIARELHKKFDTSLDNQHLLHMFNLSESLIYYINAIQSNGAVLERLHNHAGKHGFSAHFIALLDDLIIENDQCYKQARIYSTVFATLMDARGNMANNNMNSILRNLTVVNVVFLPLNLIAGIGGMSEFSMMTSGFAWWISFPALIAGMLILSLLMVVVLRKSFFRSDT
ncbi:magnesium transporter CorA family protein [Pseudomonas cichorii]|nr:magnesium transporter CorA family protein [Pseudomonas cichorii]